MRLLSDLWAFLRERKRFWLLPFVSILVLFLLMVALTQGSVEAFVYTLF